MCVGASGGRSCGAGVTGGYRWSYRSHPIWMPGTKLGSSVSKESALSHWVMASVPANLFPPKHETWMHPIKALLLTCSYHIMNVHTHDIVYCRAVPCIGDRLSALLIKRGILAWAPNSVKGSMEATNFEWDPWKPFSKEWLRCSLWHGWSLPTWGNHKCP